MDSITSQIPAPEEIRALDLGALISLRVWLTSLLGSEPASYLTTYEEILDDTLSIALLVSGKAKHEESLPPEPAWVAELDNGESHPVEGQTYDQLDDPEVEWRILQLIDKTDQEIWDTLNSEFSFHPSLASIT